VTALYRAILGREPDAPELDGWVGLLLDRLDTAVPLFIGSPEFHSLVADCRDAPTIRMLVTRLYEKALGRTPRGDEVTAWTDHIVTTCALEGDVVAFLNSPEYLGVPRTLADHVAILYAALLARESGPGEMTPWVSFLAGQLGPLEDALIDSAEFRSQQLFQEIDSRRSLLLSRPIDLDHGNGAGGSR
jgi:hypothetical protein